MKSYKTLRDRGEAELIEKRSRFLGLAAPVESEAEAMAEVSKAREAHPAASHHVYAYILGQGAEQARYSDDGEPSGTAGTPLLAAVKQLSITNAVVVVTRYFGGTLLGAGGLTRAYGQAARECLAAAGTAERVPHDIYTVAASYAAHPKLTRAYAKHSFALLDTSFLAEVHMTMAVETALALEFLRLTADISGGAAIATLVERRYMPSS